MKNILISTLIVSSLIVTSVSAAEMTDTMMKKDTMMTKDSMMMESKMTVSQLAKKHGYNWVRDRKMLAKKAGIENYRGTVAQNSKIKSYLLSMKKDMMTDTMKKDDTSMMKHEVGMYKAYSASAVTSDLAAGKSVYLFFHAPWCPGCKALDSAINADMMNIPAGTMIYKVDYDTMTDLKSKYGVTMQHTVIKLNADGSSMKKIVGPKTLSDIVK